MSVSTTLITLCSPIALLVAIQHGAHCQAVLSIRFINPTCGWRIL